MTNLQMDTPTPVMPDVFLAERDTEIRKGGGMTEDRPFITWEQYELFQKSGQDIRKFAIAYYGPHPKTGARGGDLRQQIALPAEKHLKWWGQGYVPVDYVTPPPPPPPNRWYPSMVEEAISEGKPIPEELRPQGYYGPTFKAGAQALTPEQIAADEGVSAELAADNAQLRAKLAELEGNGAAGGPTIFACTTPDCTRFFDSEDARKRHERDGHKPPETAT